MPDKPPSAAKAEMTLAAVATASIGTLVGLTVTGVLSALPSWAAVAIVVTELFLPFAAYRLVKRAGERR